MQRNQKEYIFQISQLMFCEHVLQYCIYLWEWSLRCIELQSIHFAKFSKNILKNSVFISEYNCISCLH